MEQEAAVEPNEGNGRPGSSHEVISWQHLSRFGKGSGYLLSIGAVCLSAVGGIWNLGLRLDRLEEGRKAADKASVTYVTQSDMRSLSEQLSRSDQQLDRVEAKVDALTRALIRK